MLEIILTRDDANSDSALLVEWLVEDRAVVSKDDALCVVETSKAAIEIPSPGSGTLVQLAREGDEIAIGGRIGAIAVDAGESSPASTVSTPSALSSPGQESPRATRKAVELAAKHGIDLDTIVKSGFVTADDVMALVAERAPVEPAARRLPLLGDLSVDGVSLPTSFTADDDAGVLDPAFLAFLRSEGTAFSALSEAERLEQYRRNGAVIGEDVHLGVGTCVVAPRIVLADGVEIGDRSTIDCAEVVSIGAATRFGKWLRLRCRRAFIGAEAYFGNDVRIGGGGSLDPQALLIVGDLAYVGDEAYINPCRPVVIGREAFVTMRSLLVTHNIGQSVLEGFENRFAPIVVEDRAQIGLAAIVYAGSRIGLESVVGSNSYVVTDVPPGKLAIGVPARVAGSARRTLSRSQQVELAKRLFVELRDSLELRGHALESVPDGFQVVGPETRSQVLLVERLDATYRSAPVDGETVLLTLDLAGDPPPDTVVLDLIARRVHGDGGQLVDSVREFCRKRGIRFSPGPWRYAGGLL
jgi:acetyltransferase-like isoleucine patch superfamily enzyme